jgi:hypothetical protein
VLNLLETRLADKGRKVRELHLGKLWMLGLVVSVDKRRLVVVEDLLAKLALEAKLASVVADLLKELVEACFGILLLNRHTCMTWELFIIHWRTMNNDKKQKTADSS